MDSTDHYAPRSRIGFRPLRMSLHKASRRISSKRGFHDGFIISNWKNIVGEELAAITQPSSMQTRRDGTKTLTIECASGYVAELNMRSEELMMKINSALGAGLVKGIKLRHNITGLAEAQIKFERAPRKIEAPRGTCHNEIAELIAGHGSAELKMALTGVYQAFYRKGK